jgi:uncharacterized protein (TIGR04551 family)
MPRLLTAALSALLVIAGAARAQDAKTTGAAASPETDPKVQAAIQKAVEKAKEELRNEMRAELQGAQSAAAFMGTVADQPKVDLIDLDGYFRLRSQMLNNLNLRNAPDSAGFNYFPKPLRAGSTISDANMRLRLEPTINASESVRVRMQIDVLDNYVLGSNVSSVSDSAGSPYPIPFYGSTRTYVPGDKTNDRDTIIPRRVWGELQTPIGLLSFGRMPSSWGLGIMANAGAGLDQDFGDTVDRIQFAIPPVHTPIGELIFIPILDFDVEGVLIADPHGGRGVGQPLDADNGDDGRTLGLKIVRLDTEDEIRRKLDRNEHSFNYGLYYNHRTQRYVYPGWIDQGYSLNTDPAANPPPWKRRDAAAHFGSLWMRWLGPKFRVEGELVGVYGEVGDANAGAVNPDGTPNQNLGPAHVYMKQWGGALQIEYKKSSKLSFGFELGAATGDSAPGFGNIPTRGTAADPSVRPNYGAIEGPQWGRPGDNTINNFRFNPAYQVDLIFYRRILGQVTDSVYLRPSLHATIFPGLTLDTSAIYAQAQVASSTPSSASIDPAGVDSPLDPNHPGQRPLALELDNTIKLSPTKAFTGWLDIGILKPLGGMGSDTSIAWMIDIGLAARF